MIRGVKIDFVCTTEFPELRYVFLTMVEMDFPAREMNYITQS